MPKLKVVHYLNQFFGQIGGEEKANTAPFAKDGPVGPGLALQAALGSEADVVGTIICGDSYFGENLEAALAEVIKLIQGYSPDLIIAGPAFNAGRYGTACGAVAAAAAQLGIPAVTGMHPENPGVDLYKRSVYIIETAASAVGMRDAVPKMASLGLKLVKGQEVGDPVPEGYIPRGLRKNFFAADTGAKRAVDMLAAKLKGDAFTTELPMPVFDRVPPNPAIKDLRHTKIALVTSGGIVPKGNPDHIESSSASKYGKYSLAGVTDLTAATFQTAHGGYDPVYANQDADRVLPVDVLRDLENEGAIGQLHEYYYASVGNGTSVGNAVKFGRSIAEDLLESGVQAVILTST